MTGSPPIPTPLSLFLPEMCSTTHTALTCERCIRARPTAADPVGGACTGRALRTWYGPHVYVAGVRAHRTAADHAPQRPAAALRSSTAPTRGPAPPGGLLGRRGVRLMEPYGTQPAAVTRTTATSAGQPSESPDHESLPSHRHTHARARARAHTHTHTHARTHARTNTHTHTHTHIPPAVLVRVPSACVRGPAACLAPLSAAVFTFRS